MRIGVLIEQIGPYHAARMRALATKVGPKQCHAIVVADSSARYAWARTVDERFQRRVLFEEARYEDLGRRRVAAGVKIALDELDPELLAVNGWGFVEARVAIRWAARHRRRVVMMADSQPPTSALRAWREFLKGILVAGCGAAFVAGSRHAAYLEQLGMPRGSIVRGYDVVDNAHFQSATLLRRERSGESPHFLCCARFIPEKNIIGLIAEYGRYVELRGREAWGLILAGDGPLRSQIEGEISRRGLGTKVKMAGFVSYDELPTLYAGAAALVLPSVSDTWGLVVNEAMAGGLPVLVSTACGCAPDLVEEGRNGWTFDPSREGELAQALARMSESAQLSREAMGRHSISLICDYTPETWATSLMRAFELAGELSPRFPWGLLRLAP